MPGSAASDPPADTAERPDETPAERYDRNWSEVLQELRVLQTGTQILTGFLLALAFQPAFADLDAGKKTFYLVLVVLAALSSIIALAPVAVHRMLFRRHAKGTVVEYGHVSLITALVTVSVLLVGVVAFVFDVVVSVGASVTAAAALAATILVGWLAIPAVIRARRRARGAS